jgi:hypothetical protein
MAAAVSSGDKWGKVQQFTHGSKTIIILRATKCFATTAIALKDTTENARIKCKKQFDKFMGCAIVSI